MSRMTLVWLVAAGCSATEPPGPEPEFPSPDPPPSWGVPLTGGTMIVTRDGRRAVISDPDRDRIATIDLATREVLADVALAAGDEPGRLVEDDDGRIHVVLRRGGALVTVPDPTSSHDIVRRIACSEPRGIAYDAAADTLHVACASGELVSFAAGGGDAIRRLRLDRDLRDVVVSGAGLIVTRFRTAEVLTLDAAGTVIGRAVPPNVKRRPTPEFTPQPQEPVDAVPAVAWRTIAMPDGRLVVVHQRQRKSKLRQSSGGYVTSCPEGAPVESAITVIPPGAAPFAIASFARAALPIDIATTRTGDAVAVVVAASERVVVAPASALAVPDRDPCSSDSVVSRTFHDALGAPTSVAFTATGALLTYYPEVPALVIHEAPLTSDAPAATIKLSGKLGYDSGRALLHQQTASGMACASCHPEGRDDGLVWDIDPIGLRRTQSLAGHILGRAPYHWSADMPDLRMLMFEVFVGRMGGAPITRSQQLSIGPWLESVAAPRWAPAIDPDAAARGKALFDSPQLTCASCHAGELFTNNQKLEIGSGGAFKTPSLLGVGARAPYMHNGCAATLADCFTPCGGSHVSAASLTAAQLADLIAYLESI